MWRIAWLFAFGAAAFQRPVCSWSESEPNGSIATADWATATIPAEWPVGLCGESGGGDQDFWRIPLDYHTGFFCEGAARLTLESSQPCTLTLLNATNWGGHPGYSLVGRWQSNAGHVDTGVLGVLYWWHGFDHLIAVVDLEGKAGPYELAYR